MSKSPYLNLKLKNGVQVVAEKIDTVQSVSIGFFLKSGVLYEKEKHLGVSHFIEHMLFKGTNKRTARQIAREFDRIGGYLNAFTAKDYVCYYARVVKDKLDVAVDTLTDMVKNSVFAEDEFERERGVILEEIKMYEDSPDELIHELLGQNIWRNSGLGCPILGTSTTIGSMKRDEVYDIFSRHYITDNLVICVAGNFDWAQLKKMINTSLSDLRVNEFEESLHVPEPEYKATIYTKEIEQVHLSLGTCGVPFSDKRRFALTILNAAFGGGMSSRLFQEIREKRGLAYNVYSFHASFKQTGLFGIYAGTSVENLESVLQLFHVELQKIAADGLQDEELEDTREQLKGNMLIALESTTNRMNRLASGFIYGLKPKLPEEALAPYLKVTGHDVKKLAAELLDEKRMAITMIAPTKSVAKILEKSPFSLRPLTVASLGKKIE